MHIDARVHRLITTRLVRAGTVAVFAAGAATGISLALDLETKPGAQVVYLVFAALAASLAGLAAGLLAGLLSFVPFVYFFLNEPDAFAVTGPQVVSLVLLALGFVLIPLIVSRERTSRALWPEPGR